MRLLKTKQHLPGLITRTGFRLPVKVREVQEGDEGHPQFLLGFLGAKPLGSVFLAWVQVGDFVSEYC